MSEQWTPYPTPHPRCPLLPNITYTSFLLEVMLFGCEIAKLWLILEEKCLMLHALWKLMFSSWRLASGWHHLWSLAPNFVRCVGEWFEVLATSLVFNLFSKELWVFGAKYLQFANLPSPIKNWSLFYLSQSQWNVLPRCKFGYTCKMSNAVDWPAMRWVFSCVTQYQLIILNERTQYQLIISNGRDHSHRIDRSDRFKQDKSRGEIINSI